MLASIMRRTLLLWGGLGMAATLDASPSFAKSDDALVREMFGSAVTESPLVHLEMPPSFGNGYSVPMALSVDSPMTDADHVRLVHVLAPQNPIILVARFRFTPQSGRAAITTRIRLAGPQNLIAVAEMSSGSLLMARTWVNVDTDGCL